MNEAKLKLDSIRESISDIVPKEKKRDYGDALIEKLDLLRKLHLNQLQCCQFTAFQCRSSTTGTKKYLSYRRFNEFPWLVWKTSVDGQGTELQSGQISNPGEAFCGIWTTAEEHGFHNNSNQSKYVIGKHDWCHEGSVDHLKNHKNHWCHIEAIKFLFNHFHQPATVINQLNVQANTNLANIQISNQNYFASMVHGAICSWEEVVLLLWQYISRRRQVACPA